MLNKDNFGLAYADKHQHAMQTNPTKWFTKLQLAIIILIGYSLPGNSQVALEQEQLIQRMDSTLNLAQQLFDKLDAATQRLTRDSLQFEAFKQQLTDLSEKQEKQIQPIFSGLLSASFATTKSRIDSLRPGAQAYPVVGLLKDTLFLLHERSGSLTAAERAERVSNNLRQLRRKARGESLQIIKTGDLLDIVHEDKIIVSISEADAIWNNVAQEKLAQDYRDILAASLDRHRSATGWISILLEILLTALVIIVFYYLVKFVNRLFRWLLLKVARQENKRIKGLSLKNYTLMDASRQVSLLMQLVKFTRWVTLILLVYFTLPVIFSIFPWTRSIAETLFGYVLNPLRSIFGGLWDYLPNLFTIIVIYLIFRYIIKGVSYLKDEVEQGKLEINGFYPDWASPTFHILRILLYAFMFILIFPYLPGSDSPIFQGVSVFLGFLFTLSSAGSLSNIIAGLVLTYMRLFKVGDRVKIGEVSGDILEKTLLVTRIRTTKNEIISIPNATVMSSHTINYSSETTGKGLILHTTVTLGYDVPWKLVHETLIKAAGRTNLLLQDPQPFVLQTGLEDFYVSYQLNAYTKDAAKQALIYSDLHQNIQDCCNEAGIEILSPHYQAERDGNMTTIPAQYHNKPGEK
jgi:small-conductance mechanosensitive channel